MMALDHYTHEKLAYSHIADYQSLAEELHAFNLSEEKRCQEEQSMSNRWFPRLLRLIDTGHMLNPSTLRRL